MALEKGGGLLALNGRFRVANRGEWVDEADWHGWPDSFPKRKGSLVFCFDAVYIGLCLVMHDA